MYILIASDGWMYIVECMGISDSQMQFSLG